MKNLFKKISMLGLEILVGAFALNFSACKSEEQKHKEALEQLKKEQKQRANSPEAKKREIESEKAVLDTFESLSFGKETDDIKKQRAKIEQLEKELLELQNK